MDKLKIPLLKGEFEKIVNRVLHLTAMERSGIATIDKSINLET